MTDVMTLRPRPSPDAFSDGLVGVMRLTIVNHSSGSPVAPAPRRCHMSISDTGSTGKGSVKTLAIRLEPDLHAQLSLIAQLRRSTITDEIRAAIEAHISAVKASPDLAGQADSVLADIERQAAARRDAIATLFGSDNTETPVSKPSEPADDRQVQARGRKSTSTGTGSKAGDAHS
jgi:predicted DNA-binding protein